MLKRLVRLEEEFQDVELSRIYASADDSFNISNFVKKN